MTDLIIIGAGGLGLEVAAYAEDMARAGRSDYAVKGFLDDTKPRGAMHAGYPVLGGTGDAIDPKVSYIIAVGVPEGRVALIDKLASKRATFASVIHPQSYIAKDAQIGTGAIIAPFAFVGPLTQLGMHCLLNVHACAGHECYIGQGSILAPFASVHGRASLGANVFMGNNACVTAGIRVGDRVKIAAGAVVYNEVPSGTSALGNPASFRKTP